jgi:GAF domain-containing protein
MLNRPIFQLAARQQYAVSTLRQRLIQILAVFAMVTALLSILPPLFGNAPLTQLPNPTLIFLFIAANITVLALSWRGYTDQAATTLVIVLAIGSAYVRISNIGGGGGFSEALTLLTLVGVGTLSIDSAIFFGVMVAVVGAYLIGTVQEIQAANTLFASAVIHDALLLSAFTLVGFTTRFFTDTLEANLEQSTRNAELLQASADIGQITSTYLDLDEMLNRAIEVVQERYGFYHVQVFLINDSRDQAVLRASTGAIGQQLLGRQHRLAIGSQSVIGQVALRSEPVIVNDTRRVGGFHARNELLPNTRAELAIPLMDGATIIGALDVQSEQSNAFQPDDIRALRVSANLLATAIRNARLFRTQSITAAENERLLDTARASLAEIERLNQRLTESSWQDYMDERRRVSGVNYANNQLEYDESWSPALTEAAQLRQPIIRTENGRSIIAVPVVLRGAVVGAVEIEPSEQISAMDMQEMMEAVAQRLAISLDNARLFEESQENASNEQRINEIVSTYQEANSVDELLRTTLIELSQTLGAERGAIRLGRTGENGHAQ